MENSIFIKNNSMKILKRKWVIPFSTSVLLPLLIGILIYYYCRSTKYILAFDVLGVAKEDISYALPSFISYSLPDLLWVFAFTNSMVIVWGNNNNFLPKLFKFSFPILALSSEFLQYIEVLDGTFDVCDLLAYSIGIVMSYYIYTLNYQHIKYNYYE
jgi:hypothetical protein